MTESISRRDGRIRITTVQEALRNYLSVLPVDSRLSLISFNSGISSEKEIILRSDAERQAVVRWVDGLDAEARRNGDTHLWSTLRRALQIATEYSKQAAEQTVMVRVLTDGQDTERRLTLDQVLAEFPDVDGKAIRANLVLLGDLEIPLRVARNGFQIVRDTRWEMMFPPIIQWAPQPVRVNQEVRFFDNSRSAYQFFEWRADGTLFSQEKAPAHRFNSSGEHTVNLVVSGVGGSKDSTTVRVTVLDAEKPEPMVPTFVFSPSAPEPGQTVGFLGSYSGKPVSFSWLVNGQEFATTKDSERVFAQEGNFQVKFILRDAVGTSAEKAMTVTVSEPVVKVSFKPLPEVFSGQINQFANETEGRVSSFEWDFGDGSTNTERNPAHAYQNDGTSPKNFTVVLRARTSTGKVLQSQPATVRVLPLVKPPAPVAAFRVIGDQFRVGSLIQLINESSAFLDSAWDFNGEGTSLARNPEFHFETPGSKTVRLVVRGPGGQTVTSKTIDVARPELAIVVNWIAKDGQNSPPPKGISFGDMASQHVKNRAYMPPDFDTFEINLPSELPADGGALCVLEGKAADACQIVRLVPGTANFTPVTGVIRESGRFRLDVRPETGEGAYDGKLVISPQGKDMVLAQHTSPISVPLQLKIGAPGGAMGFLILLLIAAAGIAAYFFVREKAIDPRQPVLVTLKEVSSQGMGGQTASLPSQTFELRSGENIALGDDGHDGGSGKIFNIDAPEFFVVRQKNGLELRNRSGGLPKSLKRTAHFTVADASNKKRQVQVEAKPKPPARPVSKPRNR